MPVSVVFLGSCLPPSTRARCVCRSGAILGDSDNSVRAQSFESKALAERSCAAHGAKIRTESTRDRVFTCGSVRKVRGLSQRIPNGCAAPTAHGETVATCRERTVHVWRECLRVRVYERAVAHDCGTPWERLSIGNVGRGRDEATGSKFPRACHTRTVMPCQDIIMREWEIRLRTTARATRVTNP